MLSFVAFAWWSTAFFAFAFAHSLGSHGLSTQGELKSGRDVGVKTLLESLDDVIIQVCYTATS
jgi:hypothetical protein